MLAVDFGSLSLVTLRLATGGQTVTLERVRARADGHFRARAAIPATAPNGYAELTGEGDDGARASALVRVGERQAVEAAPSAADRDQKGVLYAIGLIGVAVAGALVVAAFVSARRRPPGARS